MTCDDGRPCQRCIKREIGHLCHDENRTGKGDKQTTPAASTSASAAAAQVPPPQTMSIPPTPAPFPPTPGNAAWSNLGLQQQQQQQTGYMYPLETFGKEFSSLSDFLETLDEQAFFNPSGGVAPPLSTTFTNTPDLSALPPPASLAQTPQQPLASVPSNVGTNQIADPLAPPPSGAPTPAPLGGNENMGPTSIVPIPTANMTEKFLLTAADQEPGSRDERLKRVIRTKYEAGLLKPYNYVKGYARLSRWMDRNVTQESKQQILQPLSVLRPKFRAIAQSLRDIDLVFIEEAFERLMLDYDRVFSSMGIPACLWRRTGEIYKGNREFAELVGVDGYMLRDGRLCIYELMAEESAVNYWEKYGNVAFDSTQKAVLTSCVLRFKPLITPPVSGSSTPPALRRTTPAEEGFINCCFSFTIRRDTWGIPSMIVGNFIRC
ncbi:hypothetical protein FA95DRAFT_1556221 [Auriscalpium vulgare]|uniref:Uncharacterized protein n=1 Tax=Auriscalpium vulgare TaxID=40419 RepID=A0ACB8S0N8_9AGAM|nr:hypothetical protein FA95DRAFT_1556221 [Auriscalpium vulgare]